LHAPHEQQGNFRNKSASIAAEAGPEGATIASVSFDFVRSLIEKDTVFAGRLYEYLSKVMTRRLRDTLYLSSKT
jgi:hypothetical protein